MLKDIEFRTSLSGFNKDDVAKFIKRQNDEFLMRSNDYEREISRLSADLNAREKEYANLYDAYKAKEKELSQLEEKIRNLTRELTEKNSELDEIKEKIVKEGIESSNHAKEATMRAYTAEQDAQATLRIARSEADRMLFEAQNKIRVIKDDFAARKDIIETQKQTIAASFSQISQSINAFYAALDRIDESLNKTNP